MRENMLDRCPVSTYEQVRALSQLAGGWAGGSPAQLSAAQLAGLAFAWVPWAKVAPPLLPSSSSAPAGAADDYRGPGAAPGGVVPRVCAGPHRQRQPGAGARGDRPRRAPPGGQGAPRPRGAATRPLSSACCCRRCCVDRLLCLPLPCLLLAPSRMLSSVHSGTSPINTETAPRLRLLQVQHRGLRENSAIDLATIDFLVRAVKLVAPDFDYQWLVDESKENLPLGGWVRICCRGLQVACGL